MSKPQYSLLDHDSFCQLYLDSQLAIYRYIYAMHGGPVEEVEDLAAETFLRAWKARTRFQGTQKEAISWLVGIAHNLVIDNYRRRKTHEPESEFQEELFAGLQSSPEEHLLEREQIRVVWRLLQNLPEEHREMVTLRYILGWPVNQIGEHLGMQENTVSVNLRRILERMRRSWPNPEER